MLISKKRKILKNIAKGLIYYAIAGVVVIVFATIDLLVQQPFF